jgi:hypothetical protein
MSANSDGAKEREEHRLQPVRRRTLPLSFHNPYGTSLSVPERCVTKKKIVHKWKFFIAHFFK